MSVTYGHCRKTPKEPILGLVSPTIRIAIARRPGIEREALLRLLAREPGFEVVGLAGTAAELARLVRAGRPDLVLLDCDLPAGATTDILRILRDSGPPPFVLLLGDSERVGPDAVLRGAHGALLGDARPDELVKAICTVASGQFWVGRKALGDIVGQLGRPSRPREGHPRSSGPADTP